MRPYKTFNLKIGKPVKHKDKIEWIKQLKLREILKDNPKFSYVKTKEYFTYYDNFWPILKTGWNPKWKDIKNYPPNMEIDDIIEDIDKKLGFVEYIEVAESYIQTNDSEWFDEDHDYSRDFRSKRAININ